MSHEISYPRTPKNSRKGSVEGKMEEKKSFKDIVKSRPESKGEDDEMGGLNIGQNKIGQKILIEPDKEEKGQNKKKWLRNGCLPKSTENPKYKVTSRIMETRDPQRH
jgi:hypothetical protein